MGNVSVVIPLFNKEVYIDAALDSCLSNYDLIYEIIVVDDGSTDNSVSRITNRNDHRIRLISNQENLGTLAARALGCSQAEGDYVLFLDADDQLFREGLMQLDQLLKSREPDLLFYSYVQRNDKLSFNQTTRVPAKDGQLIDQEKKLRFISKLGAFNIAGKVMKTSILTQTFSLLGLYNVKRMYYGEDAVMICIAMCLSNDWMVSKKKLYLYNKSSDSITNGKDRRSIFLKATQLNNAIKILSEIPKEAVSNNLVTHHAINTVQRRLLTDKALMYRHTTNFGGRSLEMPALLKAYRINRDLRSLLRLFCLPVLSSTRVGMSILANVRETYERLIT